MSGAAAVVDRAMLNSTPRSFSCPLAIRAVTGVTWKWLQFRKRLRNPIDMRRRDFGHRK